ncbi:hypothetical protein EYF80_055954 [Liparis tanakae]|uniref:Uncharacterized protein n=1 Tax=Liparis tanakae TaxID=230148 RepID=A0A4Z2EZC3_9TELE|nr:hypothetical protein EYF80_055954 [Liparis tanakae]
MSAACGSSSCRSPRCWSSEGGGGVEVFTARRLYRYARPEKGACLAEKGACLTSVAELMWQYASSCFCREHSSWCSSGRSHEGNSDLSTHGVEAQVPEQRLHEDLGQVGVGGAAGRGAVRSGLRGGREAAGAGAERLGPVGRGAVAQEGRHVGVVLQTGEDDVQLHPLWERTHTHTHIYTHTHTHTHNMINIPYISDFDIRLQPLNRELM